MNDNHHRHLLVTFRHIDNLLSQAEHILATAGSASPFAEYTQDSTPVQRKVIHDYIQRVRIALDRALTDLTLPRPKPVCGALWAARGHITFADIAVAEMEPERLLGYGTLSQDDVLAIRGVVGELTDALRKLSTYVDQGSDLDLGTRLARLEETHDEVPLLRELERVITAHGLIELRGALSLLLDRLENGCFEIGVFGRVSSGKSSLLNHVLGMEVLPVGVTPVTAIPTRLRFGPEPRALIEFAESKSAEVPLTRLAEFSTEQQNPDNAKHVARIIVEIPSGRLREGVTFVDTPGLGSLATSGAEETTAYLPRCDLGLVLLDAASTLTHEDLAVVQALYRTGARAMVLVSKADLLRAPDRERTLAYTKQQLASQLGVEPSVHLVSIQSPDVSLCDEWLEEQLKPLLEAHREEAAASLKRKIGALREAVIRTMDARVQGQAAIDSGRSRQDFMEALTALRKTDALLESAEKQAQGFVDIVTRLKPAIISAAAEEFAKAWQEGSISPSKAVDLCSTTVRGVASAHTLKLLNVLTAAREQLEQVLTHSRKVVGSQEDVEALPRPPGLPLFDPGELTKTFAAPERPWHRLLGHSWLCRYACRELEAQLSGSLDKLLYEYGRRLRQWLHQAMTELRAGFQSRAGLLRAQMEARATQSGDDEDPSSIEADIQQLREWTSDRLEESPPARIQTTAHAPE